MWSIYAARYCTVLVVLLLALALSSCRDEPGDVPAPPQPAGGVQLDAPATVAAGTSLSVTLRIGNPISTTALVTLESGAGFVPLTVPVAAGRAEIGLRAAQTAIAGTLTVNAAVGDDTATRSVEVLPGLPVDPILPLVGPRSIIADGVHWTMVVAIPTDEHGNPVADDTPVVIRTRHPATDVAAATLEQRDTPTRHLLSWARIFSRTRTGEMLFSVSSQGAFGPERSVRAVPGPPVDIVVTATPDGLPADGRQLVQLSTGQITDRFGNIMLDGTAVQFLVDSATGARSVLSAVTLDGRAYTTMQAPNEPGTVRVRAVSAGGESEPVELTFVAGPAVAAIPLTVAFGVGTVELTAGPMIGTLDQFIPDGTDVSFALYGDGVLMQEMTVPSDYGYATAAMRAAGLPPGEYEATVRAGTGTGALTFQVP